MAVAVAAETWVGRAVRRPEDEPLLRGKGQFIDDIEPVPHAGHAAILRSPFAHARIVRLDPAPALAHPGVLGVLTGAEVVAGSRPFLIGVVFDPLDPVMRPEDGEVVSERTFVYGDPDDAFARADVVVRERFVFPRWSCMPVETYGVVADWDESTGILTSWANFQGPFTLHTVAA